MLTRDDALNARYFHYEGCTQYIGPRGARYTNVAQYRRASQTKTWKRNPDAFHFTVKYGICPTTSPITEREANLWHTPENCPLQHECCSCARLNWIDNGKQRNPRCFCNCHYHQSQQR